MSDHSSSGNRWEPTPGPSAAADATPPVPSVEQRPAAPPTGLRPRLTAARAKVAAATAAIFLLGSAGGFALAHAVTDDDGATFTPGQGVNTGRDGDRDGPGDERGLGGPNGDPNGGPNGVAPGQAPEQDGTDRGPSSSGEADS